MWANSCSSNATGDWSSPSTWTSCGGVVPGNGDTATILNTHTVTVSDARTVGASGASGTTALTINNGGTLSLIFSGTLTMRGDIVIGSSGSFIQAGALIWNPPDGATYKMQPSGGGSTITISGTCPSNFATWTSTPQGTTGGNGSLLGGNGNANLTISCATIKNCGSASVRCIQHTIPNNGQDFRATNVLFQNDGLVDVGASQSGVNLIWDHVSFINCTDTGNLDCFRWAISTNGSVIQYATNYTGCTTGTGTYQLDASVTRIQ
jgi:hypothetical protein